MLNSGLDVSLMFSLKKDFLGDLAVLGKREVMVYSCLGNDTF
eukprot:jgi/Antlo1/254/1671